MMTHTNYDEHSQVHWHHALCKLFGCLTIAIDSACDLYSNKLRTLLARHLNSQHS